MTHNASGERKKIILKDTFQSMGFHVRLAFPIIFFSEPYVKRQFSVSPELWKKALFNKLITYFILDKLFPSLCLSFLVCKMSSWIRWFSRSTRADSRMKIKVSLESTALPSLAGVGVGRQLYESPKPRTDLQPLTETY